ncbi:serine protease [Bacteriovoracaceae bacterium]|nr:serine protease [Bacteriovoracaceae bacterium]
MKASVLLSSFILLSTISYTAPQQADIIYGSDDRKEIYEVNKQYQHLASSLAGRVDLRNMKDNSDGTYDIRRFMTLGHPQGNNMCAEERFREQPMIADCTGFLVGENLLVTAGHCMSLGTPGPAENEVTSACANYAWVFDYHVKSDGSIKTKNIAKSKVYKCKKVIYSTVNQLRDPETGEVKRDPRTGQPIPFDDYALIELDRKVEGREALVIAEKSDDLVGDQIFTMGHPTGLPLKFLANSKIKRNPKDLPYFLTNLDTFGGNSGSPVFNLITNEVIGILVRGSKDYVQVQKPDGTVCTKVFRCNEEGDRCMIDTGMENAEGVSKISRVLPHLKKHQEKSVMESFAGLVDKGNSSFSNFKTLSQLISFPNK